MYSFINDLLSGKENREWILFGAGGVGQRYLREYCEKGSLPYPKYICDNNSSKWTTELSGISICNPDRILSDDPDKVAIVVGTSYHEVEAQLFSIGAYYYPIVPVPTIDAYFYCRDNTDRFQEVIGCYEDERSKFLFIELMESLKKGILVNPSILSGAPYYGNDVIPTLDDNELIVCGGPFNGKHLDEALRLNSNVKVLAFEPNPEWTQYLTKKFENNTNIRVLPYGLGDETSTVYFKNDNDFSAKVISKDEANADSKRIELIKLDDYIDEQVSLVWMDIEGSEQSALRGMENTIRRYHPKLAICLYHKIEDYFDIPLWVKSIYPDYKLYFRQHSSFETDGVMYAV